MASLLGEVVAWSLKQDGPVTYVSVQDALRASGLDPDAAKELTKRGAFSRACKDLKKERSIDKVETVGDVVSFQFTKKAVSDHKIDFDYECKVCLNTDTGDISCPERTDLESQATQLFAHANQTRNAADITRLVQKMFTENADLYPLVPEKGVAYFVPEVHRPFTTKIDDFLSRLGGKLCRMPVPSGTTEGNASVRDAVEAGLSIAVDELNAAVDGWDDSTRQSTMEKAIARWESINYKIEAYDEYLGTQQQKVREAHKAAQERLRAKILELKPDSLDEESEPEHLREAGELIRAEEAATA